MKPTLYAKGLSLKQFIKELQKLEVAPTVDILIASDEENNTLFKGFYIQEYTDAIVIAGLSGCELEE